MLEHTDRTTFPQPFPSVALGFTLRYPNPLSPHVVSADVLSRSLDPSTGKLRTTRLLLKRGALPRWAPRGIMERAESWVMEESEMDLWGGELKVINRNVDHTVVMEVIERQHMKASNDRETEIISSARITSSWGFFMVRRRIEHFGLSRFQRQLPRTRNGVLQTIALLSPDSPHRQAMLDGRTFERPDERERLLGGKVRERLEVLRSRARRRRREIEEMLKGREGGKAVEEVEAGEEAEEDDVPITHEEAQELAHLEREEEEHARVMAAPPTSPQKQLCPPDWRSRWLWWRRWRLPGVERRRPGEREIPSASRDR